MPLFTTTIAGSLPKPAWLAEPNRLWPPWRAAGAALEDAKRDATLLALKLQEDCGIDIVSDGEQSRQHFVHGFLEFVDGIDFARKVEIGIRADRYKAMVPTVTESLRLKSRVHAREAQLARAHTKRKLKFTLPGPMTIVDTVADAHYGDRVKMAMAFADLLNVEARALEADGVDVVGVEQRQAVDLVEAVEEHRDRVVLLFTQERGGLAGALDLDLDAAELVRRGLPEDEVEHVVAMVDRAEYKRRQAPPGIRISTKAFGRDRRLPITNRFRG
jgi:methionine synthase II (cobalamin-independent)